MKKYLICVIVALCCALLFAVCANAVVLGDIDGDNSRTASDARFALRASVALEDYQPGTPEFVAADTDGDGTITAADARNILRTAVELEILPEDPAEVYAQPDLPDPEKDWGSYDELIAAIKTELEPAKREEMMHQAEDMLMSGYCVLPLYYYNDTYLLKPDVQGVYSSPYGTKYFQFASRAEGEENSLCIYLEGEPLTLDPTFASSTGDVILAANTFSGLYTYAEDGSVVPDCAESILVSDDGLLYTVTLKEGLKWSDGTDLTAADFEYAWKRAASDETGADYGYLFSVFAGYYEGEINVTASDARTLGFALAAPCAYLEDLLAFPVFFPVQSGAVEASPEGWSAASGFVSNGAFICFARTDEKIVYKKNPYYQNADKVSLGRLEVSLAGEDDVYTMYQQNELDFSDLVPDEAFGELFITHSPDLHIFGLLGTYYASFNTKSDLFADKTTAQAACLRKAVSLLIDREAICIQMGGGSTLQPAGTFIPAGMSGGNGKLFFENNYFDPYAMARDPEQTLQYARTLLIAAGYRFGPDGKLSAETPIEIEYLTNPGGNVTIAEMIRDNLAVLGIRFTIVEVSWAEFRNAWSEGNYDMRRGGWIADFNDPVNMLELWSSDSNYNDCFFGQ